MPSTAFSLKYFAVQTLELNPSIKVLAHMLPYAFVSPVPVRLLERKGAPAVRLIVSALNSAHPGDMANSTNLQSGIHNFIKTFQVVLCWCNIDENLSCAG